MLNGIEAMKGRGGELTIATRLAEDGALLVSVSDTGVGLSAGKADQVFKAFLPPSRKIPEWGLLSVAPSSSRMAAAYGQATTPGAVRPFISRCPKESWRTRN